MESTKPESKKAKTFSKKKLVNYTSIPQASKRDQRSRTKLSDGHNTVFDKHPVDSAIQPLNPTAENQQASNSRSFIDLKVGNAVPVVSLSASVGGIGTRERNRKEFDFAAGTGLRHHNDHRTERYL